MSALPLKADMLSVGNRRPLSANKRHCWRCQDCTCAVPSHAVPGFTLLLVASQPKASKED